MILSTALIIISLIFLLISISIFIEFKNKSFRNNSGVNPQLFSVISSLSDGVIVIDNQYKPWAINDSARSFLKITKEFPSFEDISSYFPHNINLHEKIKEVIQYDRQVIFNEIEIEGKTYQIYINPVTDRKNHNISTGNIIGVSILLQDITDEKSLEKMKDEFSHSVVHELRAPMAAIKDSASLMLNDGLTEEQENKMLSLIHDQAKKMLEQISTILDAAKVDEGRLTLIKAPGDIGKLVQDQVSLFLPEAKKKNITLIAEIGNNLPTLTFDSTRITQAFTNIISNSLKYTNANGNIKVTVDTDEEYENTKNSGSVIISVVDNGIGIPEEKQHLLFTKFGQLNSNSTKEAQAVSSGLGLYITKGIIEAHGGKISIQSEVGKGTTATLTLPVNQ